jgi:hypothetical protein
MLPSSQSILSVLCFFSSAARYVTACFGQTAAQQADAAKVVHMLRITGGRESNGTHLHSSKSGWFDVNYFDIGRFSNT